MISWKVLVGRGSEIAVGSAYLLAAGLKAQNINLFIGQILAYQVFSSGGALTTVAFATLALETVLGVSMVLGSPRRKLVLATGMAMLLFFTLLIAYAWQFHGLKDCGCFGKVSMTPVQAILKNLAFMVLTGLAWNGLVRREGGEISMSYPLMRQLLPIFAALSLCLAVTPQIGGKSLELTPLSAIPGTDGAPAATAEVGPFSGYRIIPEFGDPIDLSQGEYLVALLSMTCEHCMATVPEINEYTYESALPTLVAICVEPDEGSMQEFQSLTGPLFPMYSIGNDMLTWAKLCDGLPPQLLLVRNGIPVQTWKDVMPTIPELLDAIGQGGNAETVESEQSTSGTAL